jgi:hypothetical protein
MQFQEAAAAELRDTVVELKGKIISADNYQQVEGVKGLKSLLETNGIM